MILHTHPTSNSFVRELAQGFVRADLLGEFWTTVTWSGKSPLARVLPGSIKKQMQRRAVPPSIEALTHRWPWREMGRMGAPVVRAKALTRHETGLFSLDAVYASLDRRVARRLKRPGSLKAIYAYEDGALHSFREAGRQGLLRCYDLPIAYWETRSHLLAEEAERWPEWKPTLTGVHDSRAKLDRKTQELSLADLIFVPSQFVLDSLPADIRAKGASHVVEFGSPLLPFYERPPEAASRPLRVLFAGSLSQRKGLADVLAAFKLLNRADVELVVLGSPVAPLDFYRTQGASFTYEAPRPHHDVLRLMQQCDAFVLPSIAEGRAVVEQEAMMCGLPLIVTPNAGGQDLVVEGETGFLVPIRSPELIAEKVDWLADNRASLPGMRQSARAKAAEYTWESYGDRIAAIVAAQLLATK